MRLFRRFGIVGASGARLSALRLSALIVLLVTRCALIPSALAQDSHAGNLPAGIIWIENYKIVGLEAEISGIHPHPFNDDVYFVATNKTPAYQAGQKPTLPLRYRGKLLLVNRHSGEVVRALDIGGGNYGGLAYGDGHLWVSSLDPPEILKVDIDSGRVVKRLPVSGPIGGLEYDQDRSLLFAQLYIGFPRLEVIDPQSGSIRKTLWSDESAMDLAKVDNNLLCTWASGYDAHAFSELRLLHQDTGKVEGRIRLDAVHTSMAPLDKKIAGVDGFIALVTNDRKNGGVEVRKYQYDGEKVAWVK